MRRSFIVAAGLCVVATAAAGPASAEVVLQSVHWQIGRLEAGRVASWQDVRELSALKPGDRLRARLSVKNGGNEAEEGLLLRYSVAARVQPEGGAREGTWAVPFDVDEKRVPKIAAGKVVDVSLDAASAVELYLRRVARAGWSPDRLKIQVMLEPHRGCRTLQLVDDTLEVGAEGKKP